MDSLTQQQPDCSIIIPTYERPAQLTECLAALAELQYPRDRFEVIVIDDGGRNPLAHIIDGFRGRLDITMLFQANAGPAAARNTAAARARGELLVFTDDDCRPEPSWLQHLVERFASRPERAIGGRTINALHNDLYSSTSQMIIDVGYAQNNPDPENAHFFASNNLAVPRESFRAVGGFDPNFTTSEDRDLCARWVAQGLRMTYAPEAVVRHAHHLTLWSFCRQHFRYGRGAFRYHREQTRRWNRRIRIEPSFYLALLRYPFTHEPARKALLITALLLVWHLANTAGFVWEWWSSKSYRKSLSSPAPGEHPGFEA